MLPMSLLDHLIVLRMPGAPVRVGPQGRSPVRARPGTAERSEAALIEVLRVIRQHADSATT